MIYCVTPGCFQPHNPDNAVFCFSCGSNLLLKDRYRPLLPIGKGGFGRTFLAADEASPSKSRCVVKQLHLETQNTLILRKATQLFKQEIERLRDLGNHPQIPALIDHFEQQKRLYLVQEFIDGQTLRQELDQKGAYSEAQIWELLGDLMPVLKFIHDRNILHRDIKPANIMRRRSDRKPILIDFGVAKVVTDTGLYRTGTAVGSPEYMPTEQTKGKALPASDLYSLGVTCIELLVGVPPLSMFDANENRWVWRDFVPQDKQVSDRLGRILDKLVKTSVSQRYKSAAEVLQALAQPASPPRLQAPSAAPAPNPINFFTKFFHPQAAKLPKGRVSEAGIDYSKLEYFLAIEKWEQADKETAAVLCQLLGKSSASYVQAGEIDRLPCEDLEIIDRLWVKYSKGHFGLSIQKQIFENLEEDYGQFCIAVNWPTQDTRSPYLKFSLSASLGHLPSRNWVGGYQWWRHAAAMASKLDKCQIA